MKIKNFVLPALMALFSISAAQAQTVDEIIAKHIEAIGGKEKLSEVKSLYIENSMEVMGNSAPFTEYILVGKGYKSETDFNGSKIVSCVTDKAGWSINPMMGSANAEAMPDAMYNSSKSQIYIGANLIDYAAKGCKAELAGKEDGNYKIKITDGANEFYYYVDPTSYYLTKSIVKSEMMGQTVDVITTFSDYKKTDFGILLAYAKNVDLGMFQLASKVNKVEVNKEIDAAIFEIGK